MLLEMFLKLFVDFNGGPLPFLLLEAHLLPFTPSPHIYHGNLDKLLNLQLTIGTVLSTCDCVSKDF